MTDEKRVDMLLCARSSSSAAVRVFLVVILLPIVLFVGGCGSSTTGSVSGPVPGESTPVTVLISSTANDQVSEFDLVFNSITLTNQSGKSVSLLPANEHAEFMHLNGSAEPLLTVSVPQDVYTSASATIGSIFLTCLGRTSGSDTSTTYNYGYTPDSMVTVKMPSSVTISGTSMGLSLNLLVSSSASWASSNCVSNPSAVYAITPTFNLTALNFSPQPTSPANGKLSGLNGMISAVNSAGNFTVTATDGSMVEITQTGATVHAASPVWQVDGNSSTVLQGISGLPALGAGMPVDFDATVQADGSLLATRIAVEDANTTNLTINSGPLVEVFSPTVFPSAHILSAMVSEQEGYFANTPQGFINNINGYSLDKAVFQISSQLSNLQSLPFTASFNGTSMVGGQNISITTHATTVLNAPILTTAATITLMPQTIDGTVNGVSTSGGFTTYTVALAPYDTFPQFAVQSTQTTLLSNPGTVEVYTDSSTSMLNASAPAVGSVMRFTGLVFNDSGTLRMDCSQVNDGVPE